MWVAVEDGKIAPVGTHLRLAKPAAASIKSAISFSSLPPSSPPPAAAWSTAAAAVPTSDVVPSGSLASTTAVKSSSAAGDGNRSMETASTGGRDPGKASAVQSLSTTKKSNSNGSRPATTEPPPPPPSSRQQHHEQPPQHHPQQHMYYPYPSPAASCGQLQNGFMPYQHHQHQQQQSHHGAINYAPAPTDYKPQQLHPAAHANGFHYHLPAPYAPALNGGGGAEATAATGAASAFTQIPAADPRMQKRQSPTTATPIATGDLSGIPVRNGVFPYSVGNISGVPNGRQQMVPDSNRVKIPLPMGATNARDLIPVNAYNNHHQMSPSSYLAQQHPPPPNLYGYNRSMQQHSLHPPSHPSLHSTLQLQPPAQRSQYEYEHGRSGMHTAAAEFSPPHHHISYDSVGFHTVDNAQHQQQPGQIAAVMPQQVISALNSVSNNSNHNNNNSSNSSTSKSGVPPLPAGTGAGTFRLGPRGSITRN